MAYQKQTWRDYDDNKTEVVNMSQGAVVTPERLNHMETGIANSADKAEVTAQLAQKANQLDLNITNNDVASTNSRIDTLVIGSGNANAEVDDAKVSTAKNKTFTTIRNRFEEIERGILHFPSKNYLLNGDFSKDANNDGVADSWAKSGSVTVDCRIEDNKQFWTQTATNGGMYQFINSFAKAGHKYYLRFIGKNIGSVVPFGDITVIDNTNYSGIFTYSSGNTITFRSKTSNVESMLSSVLFVDLTETFGVGKEPTLLQMDEIISYVKNRWFDGNIDSLIKTKDLYETQQIIKDLTTSSFINLVQNGDFSKGITNWQTNTNDNAIANVNNGLEWTILSLSAGFTNMVRPSPNNAAMNIIVGHKYYISFDVLPPIDTTFNASSGTSLNETALVVGTAKGNQWNHLYNIGKFSGDSGLSIGVWDMLRRTSYKVGDKIYIDNVLLIDLTATFGSGYEPLKEEMKLLVDKMGGWFDFVATLPTKDLLPNKEINSEDMFAFYQGRVFLEKNRTSDNSTNVVFVPQTVNDKLLYGTKRGLNSINLELLKYTIVSGQSLVIDKLNSTLKIIYNDNISATDYPLIINHGNEIKVANLKIENEYSNTGFVINGHEKSEVFFNIHASQGITVIGDYLLLFHQSKDDHSDFKPIVYYDKNTLQQVKTVYHNFGHVNSCDYDPKTDRLIIGNNPAKGVVIDPKLYIIKNASTLFENQYNDFSEIDKVVVNLYNDFGTMGDYGTAHQTNACFGETNDYVYVVKNNNGVVYRCYLGKGTNDLSTLPNGWGNYAPADEGNYNGTIRVLDVFYNANHHGVNQGIAYHNGKIYLSSSHDKVLTVVYDLLSNGSMRMVNSYNREVRDGMGNRLSLEPEGVAIDNGKLYQGFVGNHNDERENGIVVTLIE